MDLILDTILKAVKEAIREELQTLDKELLTAEELAGRLKVPVSWVYETSRTGKIPTVRIGRYVRFKLNDVLKSQGKED
jgi:excisionase family DNA binding protein